MSTKTRNVSSRPQTSTLFSSYEDAIDRTDQQEEERNRDEYLRGELGGSKCYYSLNSGTDFDHANLLRGSSNGEFRVGRVFESPQTSSYPDDIRVFPLFNTFIDNLDSSKNPESNIRMNLGSSKISLHTLLKFSGVAMGVLALSSIAFWLAGRSPILNPFISLMTLVASPFAYVMGVAAKVR